MHMPTWSARKPCLDLRVAVDCVVVNDAMNVQFSGHRLVDLVKIKDNPIDVRATGRLN